METPLSLDQDIKQSQPARPHGCLTAFLIVAVFSFVGLIGFLWLSTLLEDLFGANLILDLGRAGGYALVLVIPFGVLAVFLRSERFVLWRGIALTLALAGAHAGLFGTLLAIDRSMLFAL